MVKRLKIGEEKSLGISFSIQFSLIERLEKLYTDIVDENPNLKSVFCVRDKYGEYHRVAISKILKHLIQKELEQHEAY